MAKQYINKDYPVYFSYAHNSSKPGCEHISDCVDAIRQELEAQNVEYRIDRRDVDPGNRITDFMKEIGWNSEVVVLVFSDKYFRSLHCMYEFVQIKKALKKNPNKLLLCIKSGDINLSDTNYTMELEDYWKIQKNEYEKIEFHRLRNHSETEIAAHDNGFYLDDIRDLHSFFSTYIYYNANRIDYTKFVDDIIEHFKSPTRPTIKKSPTIPIAIAVVIVVALVIYLLMGKTTTSPEQNSTDTPSTETVSDTQWITSESWPYGKWTGGSRNGKPHGTDVTVIYRTECVYNPQDPLKRKSLPGQKVVGMFEDGNLIIGDIYDEDDIIVEHNFEPKL